MAFKHVGRIAKNKRKIVVAYRVIPGDANSCVCVDTASLEAADHDSLINLVESNAGQNANEFAEAMARSQLSDGSNMLARFHQTGKLAKFATSDIEMTPDNQTAIKLDELNKIIADQKGVSVEDLALQGPAPTQSAEKTTSDTEVQELASVSETPAPASDGVLTDEQLAAQYRSQADTMFKEAKRLREQAEELVPTKKKTKESVS